MFNLLAIFVRSQAFETASPEIRETPTLTVALASSDRLFFVAPRAVTMSFKAAVAIRISSSSSGDLTCPSCSKAFLVDRLSTRAATMATFFLGLYGRLFLTESRALFLPFGWERLGALCFVGVWPVWFSISPLISVFSVSSFWLPLHLFASAVVELYRVASLVF